MNEDMKNGFIIGYAWRCAEEAKEQGLFENLTLNEITKIYLGGNLNDG